MIRIRHIGIRIVLIASWAMIGAPARAEGPPSMARATLVYNLSKFVVWPEAVFSDPDAPCIFCLLGQDDIEKELALLNGQVLNDRKVVFRPVQEPTPPLECQVLVIGALEETALTAVLELLERQPIFTVSDTPRFAKLGGMVEIVSSGTRVFFHINLDAAKRAGLIIKAPLLQIATVIRETVP